ncbi:hypothetical protein VFPPC_15101 [Pochonia chlamydosporia 170]|uniref:Uncharacterized protein n=1 Tax=Pochonia chlamydosporia 170 TaxID=1380566 RepID=A0A179G365_METCM|nr:hypothetical protein VFPPC_15101 [Pochonia chlamydosporia 170]OAQ72304.1 hypothetical protein VFPPC_15101 [Pochonia chlamydosporia 170]
MALTFDCQGPVGDMDRSGPALPSPVLPRRCDLCGRADIRTVAGCLPSTPNKTGQGPRLTVACHLLTRSLCR